MKSKKLFVALALLCAVATSGCWRVHYTTNQPPGVTYVQTTPYFLYGIIGDAIIDVAAFCPGGASDVIRYAGPIDVLLWAVTIGIYTPSKVAITCANTDIPRTVEASGQASNDARAPAGRAERKPPGNDNGNPDGSQAEVTADAVGAREGQP